MSNAIKTVGALKAAAAIAILSTTTVFAAQVALPDAASPTGVTSSSDGLSIANDAIDQAAPAAEEADPQGAAGAIADVETQLADNQASLVDTLDTVVDQLTDQGASQQAIDAVGIVIDRIENGDTGLSRATDAVAGAAAVSTPAEHPTASQHPSRP